MVREGIEFEESPASLLPQDSVVAVRKENGGVDSVNFRNWAVRFVEDLKVRASTGKVLLIYDGYRAHLSLHVLERLLNGNVVVYALPAHTSGKTQPLDVVQFAAFKAALNRCVRDTAQTAPDKAWDIFDVCALLREAKVSSFNSKNVMASFRRCGVWPCDSMRLLGVPRPTDDIQSQALCSVEQLVHLLEERRSDLRRRILGDTATILHNGAFDTTNGCVMTSRHVMDLVRKKHFATLRKMEAATRRAETQQMKDICSRALVAAFSKQVRLHRMRRCARLARFPEAQFVAGVRSMVERRAAAKLLSRKRASSCP